MENLTTVNPLPRYYELRVSSIPNSHYAFAGRAFVTPRSWWCERLLAATLLLLLSPLLVGIAVLTVLLSRKSPLIAHRRVGQYGCDFWVLKFRTMWQAGGVPGRVREIFSVEFIHDDTGPARKSPGDQRVASRFARFCRRHSLDELPQLIHVFEGRMSLVGPRPVTRTEVDSIYGADAAEVLCAKPGLAGLWQVSGRNRLTDGERRALDLEWVRNQSPGLFVWILLRTIPQVLYGGDTW